MQKTTKYPFVIAAAVFPLVIYFYFLKWKTTTIYGDDLIVYMLHKDAHSFIERINLSISAGKYRPVYFFFLNVLIGMFQKNLNDYYIVNVVIQSINTLIFAKILNLFLKSPWIALLFSLTLGLSRLTFFNMTQLLFGGPGEGLAMTFFLLSMFYVINTLMNTEWSTSKKQTNLIWGLLFANLCIYTHERYIVLFPFIFLLVVLFPGFKNMSLQQKTNVGILSVLSVAVNVAIKKYIFSVPFFVGTGGTNIQFSFNTAFNFFVDGVLSVFQINSLPEYLTGISFSSLTMPYKILPVMVFCCSVGIFLFYFSRVMKSWVISFLSKILDASVIKEKAEFTLFPLFFALTTLFVLTIVPAVSTIRLEQRWLQAPFSIFIIMIVIAISYIPVKNIIIKTSVYLAFIILFLASDYNYLSKGADNFYMTSAQNTAAYFKKAIAHNVIHSQTGTIYYWVRKRDLNSENGTMWALGNGDIFRFYQDKSKKIVYIDSVYQKLQNHTDSTLAHFDKERDQVIDIKDTLLDITNEFLKDSLKDYH